MQASYSMIVNDCVKRTRYDFVQRDARDSAGET